MHRATSKNPSELAVVNCAPERGIIELRQVGIPCIGSEDEWLEVGAVGVCGSDLH
jgi:D-arabinose 1-dehydrogenase-like Zn-dependent alcohol dehydrogenase